MRVSTPSVHVFGGIEANLCISAAELLMPRHKRTTKPVTAIDIRNRGRVNKTMIARHGGSLARAAFQFTLPLGSNIVYK